jgi:rhodanese-related sulfurtransferase
MAGLDSPRLMERRESVDDLLSDARSRLVRLSPRDCFEAVKRGAVLIDIRSESQRAVDGLIPGARFVPRNVLEWRLDPRSEHCDPELASGDRLVVLLCNEGYQSSLAAATVRRFGVDATDVAGGFQAWREAGLPVELSAAT